MADAIGIRDYLVDGHEDVLTVYVQRDHNHDKKILSGSAIARLGSLPYCDPVSARHGRTTISTTAQSRCIPNKKYGISLRKRKEILIRGFLIGSL
jgi:hypothetical protein